MTTDLGQESERMEPWLKPPLVVALSLRVTVMLEESGIWVWRGLESFFGAKREEGGRKQSTLKVPLSPGTTLA